MKEDYQKAFKKVALFSLSNPVTFNRHNYQKQKGPGTSEQSLFSLFESGKFGKEGKKLQKFEYLQNEKGFLDEIKNIFHSFLKGYHLMKK